jgi:hypothetical protein
MQAPRCFLGEVAVAALEGRADAAAKAAGEAAAALPLHARNFLKGLPQLSSAAAVAVAIHPLLKRPTAVSRLRRAAVVAGCAAAPLFMGFCMSFGMATLQQNYPGILELTLLLQAQQANHWAGEPKGGARTAGHAENTVTDRQVAVFIASHYRATVANDAIWNSPIALAMIKGQQRQFAQQSVADYPAPTKEEIAAADAAVDPVVGPLLKISMPHPLFIVTVTLAVYVCLPAWIAALVFRGGLVLRLAGIMFVRRDGKRASRLRMFWRALVAWSPLWLGLIGFMIIVGKPDTAVFTGSPFLLNLALYCGLAVLSVALPERGLPDRLAGTWPVLR